MPGTGGRGRGRRTGWTRTNEPVLVCASHGADVDAGAAAVRSMPVLRQCRRSGTADLRIYSPWNWFNRNRSCLPSGPRTFAGSGAEGDCRGGHDMNIVTEANISGRAITEKPHGRPVRMTRWFIIVGLLLALLVGALVGFNAFRSHMIAQFFANNKPPPASVAVAEAN